MKQYFKFFITTILLVAVLFCGIVWNIIAKPKDTFHDSYATVIQDKFEKELNTNEPKIIVVSGSSSAFGLDHVLMEQETGYKVVNLGLHVSFGPYFISELAKANINEGDIVVLAYENSWQCRFKKTEQSLCMAGIDDKIEMYKYLPPELWREFLGQILNYAETKANHANVPSSDIYNRYVFDQDTLQMTLEREPMVYNSDIHGGFYYEDITMEITDETIDYLKEFKEYVESRGAKVVFTVPPVAEESLYFDHELFYDMVKNEEDLIGIPFISDPLDYIFSSDLMFDSMYHCNREGEIKRTELLVNDLKNAGVI